jgi:hypothetical protein
VRKGGGPNNVYTVSKCKNDKIKKKRRGWEKREIKGKDKPNQGTSYAYMETSQQNSL